MADEYGVVSHECKIEKLKQTQEETATVATKDYFLQHKLSGMVYRYIQEVVIIIFIVLVMDIVPWCGFKDSMNI